MILLITSLVKSTELVALGEHGPCRSCGRDIRRNNRCAADEEEFRRVLSAVLRQTLNAVGLEERRQLAEIGHEQRRREGRGEIGRQPVFVVEEEARKHPALPTTNILRIGVYLQFFEGPGDLPVGGCCDTPPS